MRLFFTFLACFGWFTTLQTQPSQAAELQRAEDLASIERRVQEGSTGNDTIGGPQGSVELGIRDCCAGAPGHRRSFAAIKADERCRIAECRPRTSARTERRTS